MEGMFKVTFFLLNLHPGRLTWNLTRHPWKRKIIFQTIIFRFHINLQGCKSGFKRKPWFWSCQVSKPGEVFPSFRADCRIEEMFPICWPMLTWHFWWNPIIRYDVPRIQGGWLCRFQSFNSVHVLPGFFCQWIRMAVDVLPPPPPPA